MDIKEFARKVNEPVEDFSIPQSDRGISDLLNRRTRGLNCASCGHVLTGHLVDAYEHDGGWWIKGYFNKYWLSIGCPRCSYQTSFNKFGIER